MSKKRIDFFEENGYWIEKKIFSESQMTEIFFLFYDVFYMLAKKHQLLENKQESGSIYLNSKTSLPRVNEIIFPQYLYILDALILHVFNYSKDLVGEAYDTIAYSSTFMRFFSQMGIEDISRELLHLPKTATLYGWTNRVRIDPPRDERRTYGWHQEVFYTIPRTHYVQTWAPIMRNTTEENGTIHICPGSHKEKICRQVWREIDGRALQVIVDEDLVKKYPQKILPMQMGDLLFFDGHLFHRSGNNITENEVRFSLVGMWTKTEDINFNCPKPNFLMRGDSAKQFFIEKMGKNRVYPELQE